MKQKLIKLKRGIVKTSQNYNIPISTVQRISKKKSQQDLEKCKNDFKQQDLTDIYIAHSI